MFDGSIKSQQIGIDIGQNIRRKGKGKYQGPFPYRSTRKFISRNDIGGRYTEQKRS
jgi:hypothetical protein